MASRNLTHVEGKHLIAALREGSEFLYDFGPPDPAMLRAAQEALDRVGSRPPISIEEWASGLAEDLAKFRD